MLELPSVTLCCIDTVNPMLALRALRLSAAGIRFARVLMLSDRPLEAPSTEVRTIAPLESRAEYSEFVLKSLIAYIDTPHVLLIQWDGYVINPAAWKDEFLSCDYIGAKWFWHADAHRVGNGGFSLRSRKLLNALQDPRVELDGAEDETICRKFRTLLEQEHGVVFASEQLADEFAFEVEYPIGTPFGFHGLYNFCRVVSPEELAGLPQSFTPAIARSPQLLQLGRNCLALGLWQPAAAIFRRILDEVPESVEARTSLATASSNAETAPRAGRNDPCPCGSGKRFKHCHGASAATETAVAAASGLMRRLEQAVALHRRGDSEAALPIYREVLAQQPDNPVAQHFLGVIYYQHGDLDEALPLLERAVALRHDEPEFHNNLGLALVAADREREAIAEYREALKLKADHAAAWNNLGIALQACNEVHPAIDAFRHSLALEPGFKHARWNLALSLLLDGQFEEGWREYEVRLELPELGAEEHRFPGRRWDGVASPGMRLLLSIEQGLGDTVQFARYSAFLAARGIRCVVRCPKALAPLLSTIPGVAEVSLESEPLPEYDAHVALLSLPRILATAAHGIPAAVPYLGVSATRRAAARTALEGHGAPPRVGVCWAGNPAHGNDRKRSIPLSVLSEFFAVRGITWISLQAGQAKRQLRETPAAQSMVPLAKGTELADTTALIAELDLVISVDTGIAHLAGALAKPVWILLPFAPDWRWQLGRDDSPWYPTARLLRQSRPRDWASVVTRIVAELHAWASQKP
jgi:Flp pilus assembly protein TadD